MSPVDPRDRAQAARLRRVLDGSPIGVAIITETGELLYCNQRCTDLFGVPAETLQHLIKAGEAGTYDFVFIDADKTNYDTYYESCLQLVRRGGLILIDNTLWSGKVVDASVQDDDTRAIRAINKKIGRDERVEQVLLTVGDGLTVAMKL